MVELRRSDLHQQDPAEALRRCGTPTTMAGIVVCGVTDHAIGSGHAAACHADDTTSGHHVTVDCPHRGPARL